MNDSILTVKGEMGDLLYLRQFLWERKHKLANKRKISDLESREYLRLTNILRELTIGVLDAPKEVA